MSIMERSTISFCVWIANPFGSRGFGLKRGAVDQPLILLDLSSELGDMYYRAMKLAGRYAFYIGSRITFLNTMRKADLKSNFSYFQVFRIVPGNLIVTTPPELQLRSSSCPACVLLLVLQTKGQGHCVHRRHALHHHAIGALLHGVTPPC